MKSLRFFSILFSSVLFLGISVAFVPAAKAQSARKSKQDNAPILTGASDRLPPRHRKTAKEKEYAELAKKIRESDGDFEKNWRAAKGEERQRLRSERLGKLQPTLARMNQLALEIRRERTALNGESAPAAVPVSGSLTTPDEIKGKTETELRQMGIAVGALHQKQASTSAEAQAGAAAGK